MGHSGILEVLVRVLPLPAWKAAVVRHMEECPSCRRRLAGREEVRRLLVQTEDLGDLSGIWPSVRRRLGPVRRYVRTGAGSPRGLLWRWTAALGGIAAAAVLVAGLIGYLGPSGAGGEPAGPRFKLTYARIGGQPAGAVVFQPAEADMIVVWVGP
jgi:anti-sigma factor RsiW